jgi:hypothetical protein
MGADVLTADTDGYELKQPTLDYFGTKSPITPLEGYPEPTAKGKRLAFDAHAITDWEDLNQPALDYYGTEAPDTPLEGFAEAVEQGKRLNFSYFPIRETLSLKLDELKISDLLGL